MAQQLPSYLLSSKDMLKKCKNLKPEILTVYHQQKGYSLNVVLAKADREKMKLFIDKNCYQNYK